MMDHIDRDTPLLDAGRTKPDRGPVLVVEDDAAIRRLLATALSTSGLDVVEAADGRQALELLTHGHFAVVLLDIHLPGMSGLDVLRRLRASREARTLPVILVTGDDDLDDRVRGLEAGANDYVVKPFDVEEVVARVDSQLRDQAAWTDVVDEHLRTRAVIASALSRLTPDSKPETTAALFCAELRALDDFSGVALLAFQPDGDVVALASDPFIPDLTPGEPVPAALARYLRVRAQIGPWLERPDVEGAFRPDSLLGWGTLACAPLQGDQECIGLLVLRADPDEGDASALAASRALSAAIDFGAIAAGLLRHSLGDRAQRALRRSRLEEVLALRAFTPVFQPVVRLHDLQIVGYEALTRFADGVPPEQRFGEAARVGLGIDLELATMEEAIMAASALPEECWVSINVSPALVLGAPGLAPLLRRSPRPVVLELTEHDRIDDYAAVREAVAALGQDVRLSVDDAGSGFASLHHVLALRPAFIKLDRSWVVGIHHDPARQALVAGLGHFAVRTGCRLVAEGVENQAELAALRELDAELGQGFLFGQPAGLPDFDAGALPPG